MREGKTKQERGGDTAGTTANAHGHSMNHEERWKRPLYMAGVTSKLCAECLYMGVWAEERWRNDARLGDAARNDGS